MHPASPTRGSPRAAPPVRTAPTPPPRNGGRWHPLAPWGAPRLPTPRHATVPMRKPGSWGRAKPQECVCTALPRRPPTRRAFCIRPRALMRAANEVNPPHRHAAPQRDPNHLTGSAQVGSAPRQADGAGGDRGPGSRALGSSGVGERDEGAEEEPPSPRALRGLASHVREEE